jgi:hypothetical protein
MRLRTWLFLGYSAVLALATLGLGLGLVTVLGLAATSGRMVDENFRALDVASRLRRLMSAEQMLVVRGLGAGEADAVQDMAPFEREARRLLAEARVLGGADTEVDDLSASCAAPRSTTTPCTTTRWSSAATASGASRTGWRWRWPCSAASPC